jgi:hypothetical protein
MRPGAGRAPSATLPLAYLVTAALAFVVGAAGVAGLARELAGHYYHPRVLALTHTVTLGWITLTILGASYQLVPVVLERPLASERLARWQLGVVALGVIGMVAHFFIAEWSGLLWGAALTTAALLAHVVNVALTMRGLTAWSFTARLIALALAGLTATALVGTALGVDRIWKFLPGNVFPNLHAHVHLALLGWVLPMVLGVAARVYPMFLLAREPGGWPGALQSWGLALGVPAVALGLALESPLAVAGALAVAAAVGGHLAWVVQMLRTRKRPALDWGLRFAITGTAFSVPATLLGLGLAVELTGGPRAALAYGVLALGGWASLTIVGMMLKIVPFLVWYRVYAPHAGRAPVPTLAELSWPRTEGLAFALLAPGQAALALAVAVGDVAWIRAAGVLILVGAVLFAAVLARVLSHLGARPAAPGARPVAGSDTARQAPKVPA